MHRKERRAPSPADGRDILTSLPSDLQDEILRHLPDVEDAVRTSVLARSWRHRWANCSGLVFKFSYDDPPAAVDAVLAGYNLRFSKFKLEITKASLDKADVWIRALAAKGVEFLRLRMNRDSWPWLEDALPSPAFSCSELTSLVLKNCLIPPVPPGFQGFPHLSYLEFRDIETRSPRTLEAMISMSPALTSLSVFYWDINTENADGSFDDWVVHAPNLKVFELRSHDAYGCRIENLDSLVEAHVAFEGPHLVRVLSAMTHVHKLSVDLLENSILQSQPSYFGNLTDLDIWGMFSEPSNIVSTLHLLKSARNVENLQITIIHRDHEIIEVDTEFPYAQWTGLFPTLKSVSFDGIQSQSNEMQFINFLLLEGRQLEKVHISVHDKSSKSMNVLYTELLKYGKSSSRAVVVTFSPFIGYYWENKPESDDADAARINEE